MAAGTAARSGQPGFGQRFWPSSSGSQLFRDPRMSPVGYIACVTCHQPDRAFTDVKARAHGLADLPRNTPALANLSLQRWYGWGGASDSLWMASIKPILDAARVQRQHRAGDPPVRARTRLAACYRRVFGVSPQRNPRAHGGQRRQGAGGLRRNAGHRRARRSTNFATRWRARRRVPDDGVSGAARARAQGVRRTRWLRSLPQRPEFLGRSVPSPVPRRRDDMAAAVARLARRRWPAR